MPYKFISYIKDVKNNNIKAARKLIDRLREALCMNFIDITDIDELAQQTKAEKLVPDGRNKGTIHEVSGLPV